MTEADRTSELCRFCGLTKDSGTSGSITQYIRTCVCSLGKEEGSLEDILDICLRCKKHIGKGRKGSFTQYIFRSELCDCPEPLSLVKLEQETEDPSALSKKAGKSIEEAELELDPAKFPLDRYIPLLELGRGASGRVYLARDRRLQKRVAIKVLTSSDQNQLLAFQEEAKNTSKLNNPYIVRILDFGIAGGSYPYMVLEYLQGISLEDYLKEHGPMAPDAATSIFVQLCLALEYAHEGGVFHRDLKPSNVILNGSTLEDCRVKLIDFGVAKTKQDSMEPTIIQGRTVVGTPAYMSPDQVQGRDYDTRSEIYSLGCLMFETLSGSVPFTGETALEILRKHAEEPPPDLSQYLDMRDAEALKLKNCIDKCLTKNPDHRYQSIQELERDLTPAPVDLPYSQYGDGKHKTRRVSLTILSIILIGILILIMVSAFLFSNKKTEISSESDSIKITTEKLNPGDADYTPGEFYQARIRSADLNRLTIPNLYKKIDSLKAEENPSPKKHREPLQLNLSSWQFKKGDIKLLTARPVDKLILTDSNFDDSMTEDLALLPLSYLNLSGTKISDRGITKILNLKNLNYLNLTDCRNLSEECLNDISKFKYIEHLILPPGLITDRTAPYLAACKSLKAIDLKNSNISEIGLKSLAKSESLKELFLENNPNLDLHALNIISTDFKDIRVLAISERSLNPEFIRNLGKSQKLRTLYLFGCDVNAQLLKAIATNKNLRNLAIGRTSVSGQELLCLQQCSGLVYLNLVHAPNLKREDILKLQEKLKGYLTVIAPQISKLDNVEYIMFGEGATSSQSQKKNK